MEEKYSYRSGQHRLTIENREHLEITGVLYVDSLMMRRSSRRRCWGYSGEVKRCISSISTSMRGDLHRRLPSELLYAENKQTRERGKSFLERLFR